MTTLKSYAAYTNQGPYLQLNEDAVEIDLVNNLFLLFDGFGGSNIGDKAVTKLKEDVKKFYTKVGGDPDSTLPFFYSHKLLLEGNALINSMRYAHELIKQDNMEKAMSERAGSSCLAAAMGENIMTLAFTGNCKGYLYRRGRLTNICKPDNLELVAGDGFDRHFYSAPASGFGLFDDLHLNINEVRVLPDDLFVFLTDGVYSRIEDEELESVLQKKVSGHNDRINDLFNLSNSRGNLDNQSAIFLQY